MERFTNLYWEPEEMRGERLNGWPTPRELRGKSMRRPAGIRVCTISECRGYTGQTSDPIIRGRNRGSSRGYQLTSYVFA